MKNLLIVFIWLFSYSVKAQTDTVYYNTTSVYSISNTPGIFYTWTVTPPGTIINGQGTNTISVNWGASNAGHIPNAVSVFATNQYGCVSALVFLDVVVLIPESKIFFPNAFTPNGDGINDAWSPIPFNIAQIKWQVYNRYGEKVFETYSLGQKWNGIYKGMPQPMSNFVFQCWWLGYDGRKGFDKGNLILIR